MRIEFTVEVCCNRNICARFLSSIQSFDRLLFKENMFRNNVLVVFSTAPEEYFCLARRLVDMFFSLWIHNSL